MPADNGRARIIDALFSQSSQHFACALLCFEQADDGFGDAFMAVFGEDLRRQQALDGASHLALDFALIAPVQKRRVRLQGQRDRLRHIAHAVTAMRIDRRLSIGQPHPV